MDNQKLSVGLIGVGKMGLMHSAILGALPNTRLSAICDPEKTITNIVVKFRSDLRIYKDYVKMLRGDPLDAVFITTPVHMHVPIIEACIEHKTPFFVEKPLSTNLQEGRRAVDKVQQFSLTNMVGFCMRYINTFRHAKTVVESGVLGTLLSVHASMYVSQLFKTGKGWRYDPEKSGGGCVISQGSHIIDLLCWMFGLPKAINARVRKYYSEDVEDFGHALLQWESGLTGILEQSWSVFGYRLPEATIQVNGSHGKMIVNEDSIKIFAAEPIEPFPAGWTILYTTDLYTGVVFDVGGPHFTRQDEDFLQAVKTKTSVESDIRSAFYVQHIVDAIYRSSNENGKTIEVNYE
jgi:predicted dehydrogenase